MSEAARQDFLRRPYQLEATDRTTNTRVTIAPVVSTFAQRVDLHFAKIARRSTADGKMDKSVAVARLGLGRNAVDPEELAARCAATILITASVASDVERLARRIHAARVLRLHL